MNSRTERDSFGDIEVPANHLWGAQTQRSFLHFHISTERMPEEIIFALAEVKRACARVNCDLGLLKAEKAKATFSVTGCQPNGTAVWNYVGTCPAIPTGSMNQTTGAAANMPMTNIDANGNTSFKFTVPASCLSSAGQTYFNSWKVMVSDPNAGLMGSVNANWQ